MYAIIKTGGKQYRVQEGDVINIEKLELNPGDTVEVSEVLAVGQGDNLKVGAPFVNGAAVTLKVEGQGKGKKVVVFKYKPKKNFRRKQGHRQPFTQVVVEKIKG